MTDTAQDTPALSATGIVRVPVVSSNVVSIGYDAATQRMDVEFGRRKDGTPSIYTYSPIAAEEHAAIMCAPSIGRAIAAIREDSRIVCQRSEVA